jgi:hypothetical protein
VQRRRRGEMALAQKGGERGQNRYRGSSVRFVCTARQSTHVLRMREKACVLYLVLRLRELIVLHNASVYREKRLACVAKSNKRQGV